MLEAQLFAATTFESKLPLVVEVERVDGETELVGCTTAKQPVKVPRHRAWWVSPTQDPWRSYGKLTGASRLPYPDSAPRSGNCLTAAKLQKVLAELEDRRLPGLALRALSLGDSLERLHGDLEALDLERSFTRAGLGPLARLSRLRRLVLSDMGRLDLRPIRDLPELVTLDLAADEAVSLDDVPRSIVRLGLRNVAGLDLVLEGVGALSALTRLDASSRDLTDAGARHVAKCPELIALNLANSQLTDKGLRALAKALPRLEEITLDRCDAVTDKGLAAVATMTSLRTLSVDHCRGITAKGLAKLGALPNLRALYLRATGKLNADRNVARDRLRESLTDCKIY